jgi:phosphatidylinositol alpha-1,6-mannosyltransferase
MVCVSHYTARAAAEAVPGIRTTVIPNGIDFERFAGIEPRGGDAPTVLSVGAVKERKGTLALVRTMRAICDTIPDARCIIAGSLDAEPDYAARVKAEIGALGLEQTVRLAGHVSDAELMRLYSTADVFALPSLNVGWKFEGFGLALLEASAAGLPVIGTRDCGAEDAIDDGVTGLLIPQTDLETGLSAAILRLLRDPDERRRMGTAGRELARRQTWDRAARRLIAVYEQEVQNKTI